MTANKIAKDTIGVAKTLGETIMADTPRWAKVVRLFGYAAASIGLALASTNPVTAPAVIAALIPYGSTLTFAGTAAGIFVQMFKKDSIKNK